MATKPLPSQEVLRQLLDYDPETGVLRWKERGPEWFIDGQKAARHIAAIWNSQNAGKEAFRSNMCGYRHGHIQGVTYLAHRIIWRWVTGLSPDQIDHIDGNRQNNAWKNLRSVDPQGNNRNVAISRNNTSGVIGVGWDGRKQAWRARVTVHDKTLHLGYYDTLEAAAAARKAAERKYGFHENHGRQA